MRVLQLADNPESRWAEMRQAALDRLKSENEALLKRLRELGANSSSVPESGSGSESVAYDGQAASSKEQESSQMETQVLGETADLVPRASWELVHREKMELEEVVRQKEKRLLRLKEVNSHLSSVILPIPFLICTICTHTGLQRQRCRIPRRHRLNSRRQAILPPKRRSPRNVHI